MKPFTGLATVIILLSLSAFQTQAAAAADSHVARGIINADLRTVVERFIQIRNQVIEDNKIMSSECTFEYCFSHPRSDVAIENTTFGAKLITFRLPAYDLDEEKYSGNNNVQLLLQARGTQTIITLLPTSNIGPRPLNEGNFEKDDGTATMIQFDPRGVFLIRMSVYESDGDDAYVFELMHVRPNSGNDYYSIKAYYDEEDQGVMSLGEFNSVVNYKSFR